MAGVAGGFYLAFEQSFTTSQMGLTPMSIDVTMLVSAASAQCLAHSSAQPS